MNDYQLVISRNAQINFYVFCSALNCVQAAGDGIFRGFATGTTMSVYLHDHPLSALGGCFVYDSSKQDNMLGNEIRCR